MSVLLLLLRQSEGGTPEPEPPSGTLPAPPVQIGQGSVTALYTGMLWTTALYGGRLQVTMAGGGGDVREGTTAWIQVTGVRNMRTGALLTSADAVGKVQVRSKTDDELFAETAMTYDSAGSWYYDGPAAAFTRAGAPWTVVAKFYNASGGTLLATYREVVSNDAA